MNSQPPLVKLAVHTRASIFRIFRNRFVQDRYVFKALMKAIQNGVIKPFCT